MRTTTDQIISAGIELGEQIAGNVSNWRAQEQAMRELIAAALADARRDEAEQMKAESAGREHAIGHLSALVETQRLLLVDVEDICGRDGHGGQFEDGESEIIDRVRAHLATMAEPESHPTPAPDVANISDRLVAISSAIADLDDRKAQELLRETLQMLAALPEDLSLPAGPRQAVLLTDEQIERAVDGHGWTVSELQVEDIPGMARDIEAAVLSANGLEAAR